LKSYKSEVENKTYPSKEYAYEYPSPDLNEINKWIESIDIDEEAQKVENNLK